MCWWNCGAIPGISAPTARSRCTITWPIADAFAKQGAQILLVYPGPPADLGQHAKDFLAGQPLPENFHLVIDPDYAFTKLYDLRWDAPHETAYPSTFILDRHDTVLYRKISHSHGDRTTAAEVLAELAKTKTGASGGR